MGWILKIGGLFVGGTVATLGAACGIAMFWWLTPPQDLPIKVEYEVKAGASVAKVASDLASMNVLRWPILFRFYASFIGSSQKIKTGYYEFNTNMVPAKVLEDLVKGVVVLKEFSHPPGYNLWQVAEQLSMRFPETSPDTWVQAFHNPLWMKKIPPGAQSLEGYLFPDSYKIHPHPKVSEVIDVMIRNFQNHFTPEIQQRGEQLGLSPRDIVTLASIIEKETGKPEERPLISAVFHNRLRKKMRLQTDPTVIYGIWSRFEGNLRRVDLETYTPYNTYVIPKLPPGPISNPGREALEAAVSPAAVNYLYFVAKGDGSHYFSSEYAAHSRAVQKYQVKASRRKK